MPRPFHEQALVPPLQLPLAFPANMSNTPYRTWSLTFLAQSRPTTEIRTAGHYISLASVVHVPFSSYFPTRLWRTIYFWHHPTRIFWCTKTGLPMFFLKSSALCYL
jgi:hypothetical protein